MARGLLGKGIDLKLSDFDGGFFDFMRRRLDRLEACDMDVSDLSPAAREVLDEVITALRVSQHWYTRRDEEDGTRTMYAVDTINRLQSIYGLKHMNGEA